MFSDITERKLAEADLRELHRELDQRVIDRTAELLHANQHLQLEVQQRERAQEALRDAERFFHATIDSLTDRVLVLDQAGSVVHANQACLDFVGQTRQPLHYLEFCETDPRWQRSAGRELAAGIRSVIAGTAETFALEYEFATRAGPRWSQARISRFRGEGPLRVVVAHTDITERKLMDGALRRSHAQLRQLACTWKRPRKTNASAFRAISTMNWGKTCWRCASIFPCSARAPRVPIRACTAASAPCSAMSTRPSRACAAS